MPGGTVPSPAQLKPPRGSGLCLRVQPGALPWRSPLPLYRLPSLSLRSSIWNTTAAKQGDQSRQHPSLLPSTGRDAHTRSYLRPPDPPSLCPAPAQGSLLRATPVVLPTSSGTGALPERLRAGSVYIVSPSAPRPGEQSGFPGQAGAGRRGRTRNSRDRAARPVFPRAGQGKLGSSVPVVLSRSCQPCPCRCGCSCLRGRKGGKMKGKGREGKPLIDSSSGLRSTSHTVRQSFFTHGVNFAVAMKLGDFASAVPSPRPAWGQPSGKTQVAPQWA